MVNFVPLFDKFPSCLAERGDEVLVQSRELVALVVDENVLVGLFVPLAYPLNETVAVQYFGGGGGDPHEGLGIFGEDEDDDDYDFEDDILGKKK